MSEANNAVMKSFSEALGMAPLVLDEKQEQLPVVVDAQPLAEITELSQADKEAEEDFALARKNAKDLLERGTELLDGISRVASGTEHPRAFEVAANMLKTLQDLNQGLLELHERRRQLVPVPEAEKPSTTNITNNNVFVGTTQELLDMLEERDRGDNVIEYDPRDSSK